MNKLIYIDAFRDGNSNYYWLEEFKKKFDDVLPINIFETPIFEYCKCNSNLLLQKIEEYKPDMIHIGASVKISDTLPIETIKKIKQMYPNIRITAFYGDIYYNVYSQERAKYIDLTLVTNASNMTNNKMFYHPCPVKLEWDKDAEVEPKYDLAFIGSRFLYYEHRKDFLLELAKDFSIVVWGNGWHEDDCKILNPQGNCELSKSPVNYRMARIALDDPTHDFCKFSAIKHCFRNHEDDYTHICQNQGCIDYEPTYKWFSNRLVVAMLSKRPVLACRRNGADRVIHNVEWFDGYHDIDDVKQKIEMLLRKRNYANILANNARKEVERFTFDKMVDIFMGTRKICT